MARLPKPIPPAVRAELSLFEDGAEELKRLEDERKAILDQKWPKPELGDILTLKERLESERKSWREMVEVCRIQRFNEDQTPAKWAKRLNLPPDRRFHSNLSGNEINRVVALLNRNAPKVTVPPVGSSDKNIQRGELQSRWSQEFLKQVERDADMPIWQRGDDGATETGLGGYEWYMTDRWEEVDALIEERAELDPDSDEAKELDKQIDEQLKAAGLPFAIRALEPTSVFTVSDEDGTAEALIVERKNYRQVYRKQRERLSQEEFNELQLPNIGDRAWAPDAWTVQYAYMGATHLYNGAPDQNGDVEVIRKYDRRWLVEIVAGRIVRCEEHGLPGVPVFTQLGKVTSSTVAKNQIQGVTWGMLSQERIINDIYTLQVDNEYTYKRPFPVVATSENGTPLLDKEGQPVVINLSDPTKPPQLGPGQTIVDAFGAMRDNDSTGLLQSIAGFWQMSGLNPVSQGEAPGSDSSGFALNLLNAGGQALYESMLQNKARTLGEIIDFSRIAVRDSIGEKVYLSVPTSGKGIEYLGLSPDDVDEVPARVDIDPISDAQRIAFTQWLIEGNKGGYLDRRSVMTYGYGNVIDDPDETDDLMLLEAAKAQLLPVIVQSVAQQIQADAFPETMPQQEAGMTDGEMQTAGVTPANRPTIGAENTEASQVSRDFANSARGGQQPASQGNPVAGP